MITGDLPLAPQDYAYVNSFKCADNDPRKLQGSRSEPHDQSTDDGGWGCFWFQGQGLDFLMCFSKKEESTLGSSEINKLGDDLV